MSKKITISVAIIIWIVMQIYTGFLGYTYQDDTWPFVNYPMYAPKQNIGDRVTEIRLYGRTVSGNIVKIKTDDFGLWYWGFRKQGWPKLLNPETRESYASELFGIYNQRQKDASLKLRDLQVVAESREVTREGPSELISEILIIYSPEQL
jgi:hypothetical protein